MAKDIYKKLSHHLDNLPGGFPSTENGVELRILRRLFSPEEAELAVKLTLIPEESNMIARRAKLTEDKASRRLEEMARKGLIYSLERKGHPPKYMATQFVIGIWEFHVNDLDPDLIQDFNEYIPTLFNFDNWKKAPQLRTVPVERSLDVDLEVLPYEDAVELVKNQTKFLEAPCICRKEHRITGEGCDRPKGNCLVFGRAVDYYVRNGIGRVIDKHEALELLKKADKTGLVLQTSFSKKIANICCCCGCCCQVLKNFKRHPYPASLVSTPFVAALNSETCKGCGACSIRCQMETLQLQEDKAVLDVKKCIGCGLCVSTCPTKSLALVRKPAPERPQVPDDLVKAAIKRGQVRGKLGPVTLRIMLLRSKWGRFRAGK